MKQLRIKACEEFGLKDLYYDLNRNGARAPALETIHQLHITENDKLDIVRLTYNAEDNAEIEAEMLQKMT